MLEFNMFLSQEDRNNNQLFIEIYHLQDRMIMNVSQMEEYQEQMKKLLKKVEGKEWVVSNTDKK